MRFILLLVISLMLSGCVPPELQPIPDQETVEGAELVITANATDADGIIVGYQWSQINGVPLTLEHADTAQVSFIAPQVDADSIVTLSVKVIDDTGIVSFTDVKITILDNQAPLIEEFTTQQLAEGEILTIAANALDPDGSIASYQWTQLSGPAIDIAQDDSPSITIQAPQVDASVELTFLLKVRDNNGAQAEETLSVIVQNLIPPTIYPINDLVMIEGEELVISIDASDSDGSIVDIQWQQLDGPIVELESVDANSVAIVAPLVEQDTVVTLLVSVLDNDGASASNTIIVTIKNTLPEHWDVKHWDELIWQ